MIILLFLIALIYASAGFGGGSMYLAVLSHAFPNAAWIRIPSLLCNIAASGVGSGRFILSKLLPACEITKLLCVSVPLTMWAASWSMPKEVFLMILGCALILSGLALFAQKNSLAANDKNVKNPWWLYPVVGCIGVVAGITGIGGGIYLAPVLHASNWAPPKKIAASTSLFIFVNSIFSLFVVFSKTFQWQPQFGFWMAVVGIGALLGGHISVAYLKGPQLKIITAFLLIIVGCKIIVGL